jgi:hypothetical protein
MAASFALNSESTKLNADEPFVSSVPSSVPNSVPFGTNSQIVSNWADVFFRFPTNSTASLADVDQTVNIPSGARYAIVYHAMETGTSATVSDSVTATSGRGDLSTNVVASYTNAFAVRDGTCWAGVRVYNVEGISGTVSWTQTGSGQGDVLAIVFI